MNCLQLLEQAVVDAVQQTVAVVQPATDQRVRKRLHSFVAQSPSLSPITHGSSSSSSSPSSQSPLASSLTRSVFHSELKTWLFGKSFPP